jgi:hypothetical protein
MARPPTEPAGEAKKPEAEKDAKGQFVRTEHGRKNDGVDSAEPVVVSGTDDATFETDPKDESSPGEGRARPDRH